MTNVTHEITIPATAGDLPWTTQTPIGRKWKFLRLKLKLICGADVVTRKVVCGFTNQAADEGKDIAPISPTGATANQIRHFIVHATPIASYVPSSTLDGLTYVDTVNFDGYGFNTDKFVIVISGGAAGDSYSGSLLVEASS